MVRDPALRVSYGRISAQLSLSGGLEMHASHPIHWLDDFIADERTWLQIARERGVPADVLAVAESMLDRLAQSQIIAEAKTFSVGEAANLTGFHSETIRRFAREGRFGDHQTGARIHLKLKDLQQLGFEVTSRPQVAAPTLEDFQKPRRPAAPRPSERTA